VLVLISLGVSDKLEAFTLTLTDIDYKFTLLDMRLQSIPQLQAIDAIVFVVPKMLCEIIIH
jgi:hypothetical protein